MSRKAKPKLFVVRTIEQIRGVRSNLASACNLSEDGCYAQVDLKNARNAMEVCDQLIRPFAAGAGELLVIMLALLVSASCSLLQMQTTTLIGLKIPAQQRQAASDLRIEELGTEK